MPAALGRLGPPKAAGMAPNKLACWAVEEEKKPGLVEVVRIVLDPNMLAKAKLTAFNALTIYEVVGDARHFLSDSNNLLRPMRATSHM